LKKGWFPRQKKIDEAVGICHCAASFNSKAMKSWCKTALDHCLAPGNPKPRRTEIDMKTPTLCNPLRVAIKLPALALALAAGLAAGSAQALTTTATFNLGAVDSGTSIPAQSVLAPAWIAAGTLPPGSILRSVSIDARIDTEGGDETYASDLFVYIDPGAPPSGGGILQVGGFDALGSPTTFVAWANGSSGTLGTTCVDTKTAPADFPATIDLNSAGVFLGSRGLASASWSGTVTVEYDDFVPAAILSFGPGAVVGPLVGNAATIAWTVPGGTDVTTLAPTYTLSSGAADKVSGGTYDFTNPVVYTVTDGATVNTYTVTVTPATTLIWNVAGGGAWDTATVNWLGQISGLPTTFANGNEVIFNNTAGGAITIDPDMSPLSTTVSAASGTYTFSGGPIATGSLTKSGNGNLTITTLNNTYDGGTVINAGQLRMDVLANAALGTGPVTLNGGQLFMERITAGNNLIVNGGTLFPSNGFGNSWNGTVTLNSNLVVTSDGNAGNMNFNGTISGVGGLTFSGPNALTPVLAVANSYSGPTSVTDCTLRCDHVDALGSGVLSISSAANSKVNLNYSGTKNIAGLTLGGVEQLGGTHGSIASGAANPNDTYFTPGSTGTVTVPASSAKNILTFSFGVLGAATVNDNTITLEVPPGTDRTNLAPTYTVSPGASGSPVSGTSLNFTSSQIYTITAENLSTKQYTVTVTETVLPDIFTWANAITGNWSIGANWTNELATGSAPLASGRSSYTLNFTAPGTYTATNNLSPTGFQLNTLNLAANVTLAGNPLAFVANNATLPTINQNSGSAVSVSNNLDLGANMTYGGTGGGQVTLTGLITGAGSLTKNGSGTLSVVNVNNSFAGGTIINSGTLRGDIDAKVGTGPITLNGGILLMWRFKPTNALTVNGGSITSENGFNQNLLAGPVTLNVTLPVNAPFQLTCSNTISGVGGLTKTGSGLMILSNTCTSSYFGPTTVTAGTLRIDRTDALSGNSALSISGTGKMNLNYLGTKTVASLTLGGVAKTTPGTYGSVASLAQFQDDTYFTAGSTGTVTIGGASDYDTWLGEFTFAPGADKTPTGDPDGDNMSNQEEYAFGLNPTLGSSVNPIVQQLNPATGNFQYTRRATPAATGLTYTVLTSTTLAGWAAGGATETGFTTAGNIQTVTVNVTAPPVGGKLFVRVQAAPTP
jgi:autotransporter-associated beta strand protein